MKRIFLVMVTLVVASFFIACGDQGANNKPANNAAPANNTAATKPADPAANEADVKKLMGELAAALAKNDADAAAKFYSDDYHLITPTGVLQTKADRLADMKSGATKFDSFEYTDIKVRSYGDVAVATTTVKIKGTMQGKPATTDNRATLVLNKTKDGWKVVNGQATPMTAAPAKADEKRAANTKAEADDAAPPAANKY
jgi:uncharacterized protein (TIGR02246 family)